MKGLFVSGLGDTLTNKTPNISLTHCTKSGWGCVSQVEHLYTSAIRIASKLEKLGLNIEDQNAPSKKIKNTMHKTKIPLYARVMSNNSDPSTQVRQEIVSFVTSKAPSAALFEHPASRTSEESMEARHKASGERVTGAKALLVKMDVHDKPDAFAVIVLPGFNKLDSKALKQELKVRIPGMRSFRFATPEEMDRKARGMQPGKMPPFGRPVFPDIDFTFIDQALLDHKRIGFNAADFEKSILMNTDDYLKIVTHDGIFSCST